MSKAFTRWHASDHLRTPKDTRLYLEACAEEDPGGAERHRAIGEHKPAGPRGRDEPRGPLQGTVGGWKSQLRRGDAGCPGSGDAREDFRVDADAWRRLTARV